MNVYVDTSAALKLWIDEPQAEAVRLALEDARQVASSVLIRVEAASTLARLLRERRSVRDFDSTTAFMDRLAGAGFVDVACRTVPGWCRSVPCAATTAMRSALPPVTSSA